MEIDESMLVHREGPDPDPDLLEPSYLESVRRYQRKVAKELRLEWIEFHEGMSRLHRQLSEEHHHKALLLDEEGEE